MIASLYFLIAIRNLPGHGWRLNFRQIVQNVVRRIGWHVPTSFRSMPILPLTAATPAPTPNPTSATAAATTTNYYANNDDDNNEKWPTESGSVVIVARAFVPATIAIAASSMMLIRPMRMTTRIMIMALICIPQVEASAWPPCGQASYPPRIQEALAEQKQVLAACCVGVLIPQS